MQGELPTEITQTCLMLRKKMAKIVQAKSIFCQQQESQGLFPAFNFKAVIFDPANIAVEFMETISLYLDLIDQIDNCLTAYKNRYLELHEAKIAKIEKK
jgi:hypothetical protein